MADSTLTKIQARENELDASYYARMDADRKAVHLEKYTFTGLNQYKDKEVPGAVSVTMNKPGVFAKAVTSVLKSATPQTVVEGLSSEANHNVEEFLDGFFYMADVRIRKESRGNKDGLWGVSCNRVALRGPIAARVTFDSDGRPHILDIDMRFCPWEDDWTAPHYRRRGWRIEREYGLLGLKSDQVYDVYDYWTDKVNEVWLAEIPDHPIRQVENPYGVNPICIQCPSTGYNLEDEGEEDHEGESIFALIRDLIPEWNRLNSIKQTKAIELIKPPYKHSVPAGTPNDAEPQAYPHEVGQNFAYKEGEEPRPLEVPDLNRAYLQAEAGLAQALHEGSPNITELADVAGMRNASWIAEQTLIRDKILTPLTQCLQLFYAGLSVLAVKERRALKYVKPISLGRPGKAKTWGADDLPDPDTFTVDYRFMPDNPHQKLASYSVAIALRGTLSQETIITDIMQSDDPDGEIDRLKAEQAEQMDPVIFYYNRAHRMVDVAEKKTGDERKQMLRQARVLADRMGEEIKRRKMTSVDRPAPAVPVGPSGASALAAAALPGFVDGGGRGGGSGIQPQGVTSAG